MTYPALEASAHVAFLVSGAGKRGMLRQLLSGGSIGPATRLRPAGELLFIADRDAARE